MKFLIVLLLVSFKSHADGHEKWISEQGASITTPTETTTVNGKPINFTEDFGLADLRTKNPEQFVHYERYQSTDTAHLERESRRVKAESYKEEGDATRDPLYAEDPIKISRQSFEESSAYMSMADEAFLTRHDAEADDPEAALAKYYGDCEERVVRTKRQTILKERQTCEESKPSEKRYCVRFLKSTKNLQKRRIYLRTKDMVQWDENVHGPYYRTDREGWPEGRHIYGDYRDDINVFRTERYHEYRYQKRETSIGLKTGLVATGWGAISKGEYDAIREGSLGVEEWEGNCTALVEAEERGECRKVSTTCQGGRSKTEGGETFERECWQYEEAYECGFPSANSCQKLREEGCEQSAAICKHEVGGVCYVWDKVYQCSKEGEEEVEGRVLICGGSMPVCLEGECGGSGYLPNQNFMHAVSRLEALKSMSKHIEGDPLKVFKGEEKQCKINMLNFKDCCGNGGGWGVSANLTSCGEEEQTLGEQRDKGLCVASGSYCSEKIPLLGCSAKKHRYCCFPTKLIRIIQEQGRLQLRAKGMGGLDWDGGNCRGLTAEELSQVDFSKIDLREALDEMLQTFEAGKAKADISAQMTRITRGVGRDLSTAPDEKKARRFKTTGITREGFNPKETM